MIHPVKHEYSAYFVEIAKPERESVLVKKLEESGLKYIYYRCDGRWYLLVFGDKSKDRSEIFKEIKLVRILDRKKQRFHSVRGYLKMALEMRKKCSRVRDLAKNVEDLFWEKLERALRKNQKNTFQNFIYDINESTALEKLLYRVVSLEKKVESLESEVKTLKSYVKKGEEYKNWKDIEEFELKEIIIRRFQLLKEGKLRLDLH